jgi:2-keto-3-deoxy-6-phosphogluconate aldolase
MEIRTWRGLSSKIILPEINRTACFLARRTGGVSQETARAWLSVAQVLCVGGSWMVPAGIPNVDDITSRALQACALSGEVSDES